MFACVLFDVVCFFFGLLIVELCVLLFKYGVCWVLLVFVVLVCWLMVCLSLLCVCVFVLCLLLDVVFYFVACWN